MAVILGDEYTAFKIRHIRDELQECVRTAELLIRAPAGRPETYNETPWPNHVQRFFASLDVDVFGRLNDNDLVTYDAVLRLAAEKWQAENEWQNPYGRPDVIGNDDPDYLRRQGAVKAFVDANIRSDRTSSEPDATQELEPRSPSVSALGHGTLHAMHECDTDDLP